MRIGAVNHVAGVVDEVAVPPFGAFDGLRADLHLALQRPAPGHAADKQQQPDPAANAQRGRVTLGPRAPGRIGQALLDDAIEFARGLQAVERDPERRDHQVTTGQDRQLVRPCQQGHRGRFVRQRAHEEAEGQVIPSDAIHFAAREGANGIAAGGDYLQRGPSRFGQGREQQVVDGPVFDGHPHAPQVVDPARIVRQARAHHDHLRQGPRLVEQLVFGGALVGVRQEHHVGLAGVERGHLFVTGAEANLHGQAGFAREGAYQLDIEALGIALVIEVLVGRKLAIAAVNNGLRFADRILRDRGCGNRHQRPDHEQNPEPAQSHGRL